MGGNVVKKTLFYLYSKVIGGDILSSITKLKKLDDICLTGKTSFLSSAKGKIGNYALIALRPQFLS